MNQINNKLNKIIIDCQILHGEHGVEYEEKCKDQIDAYSNQIIKERLVAKSKDKIFAMQLCIKHCLRWKADTDTKPNAINLSDYGKEKLQYINGHSIATNFPNTKPDLIWVGAVLDLLQELGLGKYENNS